MDNQINFISANTLPKVVVTEPSPVSIPTETVESLVKKIESVSEVSASGAPSESAKQALEEAAAAEIPESSSNRSNGEFVPAQECNACIVPIADESTAQQLESVSTATPEPEDNFRTADDGCCANYGMKFIEYYGRVRKTINSRYALPFWFLLLASPVSAGYVGAFFMYSCPASHSLPMLMFTVAVSLMGAISFRISRILRKLVSTAEEDEWGKMLQTLLLISSFLTTVFFISESMAFWQMAPTTHDGMKYCDSEFVTFSFWWNSVMSVIIVPIFFFPV